MTKAASAKCYQNHDSALYSMDMDTFWVRTFAKFEQMKKQKL